MLNSRGKRILVTGPDGFVGSRVCAELIQRNHIVRAAQWQPASLAAGCESVIVGNIGRETEWQFALQGVETVIHLAARVHVMKDTASDPLTAFRAVNLEGTRHLAECAAASGVHHLIFVSTIKVNGESTHGKPFSEDDAPNPEDGYSISKWEAEQALHDIEKRTGMAVTILRPPLVYGPGVKANFLKMIQFIESGMPLPLGSVKNKRSLIGLGNICDVICLCVEREAARGETFVVSDDESLSTADLARRISLALNKKPRIVSLNPFFLRLLGFVKGKQEMISRLTESLEIDSSKMRRVLGWKPPYSIDDELARTAKWYYDSQ